MIEGQRVRLWEDEQPEARDTITYGHWDDDEEGDFVIPEGPVSGSDYSGNLLERSNYDVFREQFADSQGTEWWETPGGHGTFGLLCRVDADERIPEMEAFFEALRNYPVADERAFEELEMTSQQEAWADYGRRDFIRGLQKLFSRILEAGDGIELLDLDQDDLFANVDNFYVELADLYGEYPANEQGGDWYFRTRDILERLEKFITDFSSAEDTLQGETILWELLQLDAPEAANRYEHGGRIDRILQKHRDLWPDQRAVFRDIVEEKGPRMALAFLEQGKGALGRLTRRRR